MLQYAARGQIFKLHNILGGYAYHVVIFHSGSREPAHNNECVPLP